MAAGHHLSSPLPVRRTLGRVLILRGNRREPSSDWAAWISGARFFFLLPCQAGCLSVTGGAVGSLRAWPPPRERGHVAHRSRVAVLPRAAFTGLITLGVGLPPRAGVTEARGPLCPRHRWSLWIVGRWPVSIPRFPGGAAPWDPPFVGVVHGVRTPLLRAVCRSPPAPVRAFPGGILCVRTGARGAFSGGNWMVALRSPGAPGRRRRGRALVRPFQLNSFTSWRSRSGALLGPRPGFDRLRRGVPAGGEPR